MYNQESRRLFLEDYWLHLSGYAYGQYLRAGRGAILIGNSPDASELSYITQEVVGSYPEINKAIQEYDPELQIVAVIPLSGTVMIDVYRAEPSPPGAYRALARRKKSDKSSG